MALSNKQLAGVGATVIGLPLIASCIFYFAKPDSTENKDVSGVAPVTTEAARQYLLRARQLAPEPEATKPASKRVSIQYHNRLAPKDEVPLEIFFEDIQTLKSATQLVGYVAAEYRHNGRSFTDPDELNAFYKIDANEDGLITKKELRSFANGKMRGHLPDGLVGKTLRGSSYFRPDSKAFPMYQSEGMDELEARVNKWSNQAHSSASRNYPKASRGSGKGRVGTNRSNSPRSSRQRGPYGRH